MLLYSATLQGLESGKCCGTRQMFVAKQLATFVRQNVSIPSPTDASKVLQFLTLNMPSLARQRCLSSWGPRRTPWFFFVISQLFDAVDYSNYVFWVSETIIQ